MAQQAPAPPARLKTPARPPPWESRSPAGSPARVRWSATRPWAARKVGEVVEQDLPQPGSQLAFRVSLKIGEILLRFQKRFLDQIGSSAFSPQIGIELALGEQQQIAPAGLEGLAQRLGGPLTGRCQPLLGVGHLTTL